ncbi:MAG: MmcQ/YjbR family DNA-binding protein [Cyclobacteriaceae bacterium]|nr:MmcQ/YjbR family DNA-binding protein [Cyclobacteriaceae bacterium]
MNVEQFRSYCLAKRGVTEAFPFGEQTMVFKVMGKMFALADVTIFESINLKCDPEEAMLLREQYPAVLPGYHMNKKHWNTVLMNEGLPDKLVKKWIDDSYKLVVAGLPARVKAEFKQL